MVSDFAFDVSYWVCLFLGFLFARLFVSFRPLDFIFFIVLFLSQYVVHSLIVFGVGSDISLFCALFFLVFLFSHYFFDIYFGFTRGSLHAGRDDLFYKNWLMLVKCYLFVYYLLRLMFYPFLLGELQLDDRLAAQVDNQLIFYLGLAAPPAIAAYFYALMKREYSFGFVDFLIVLVVLVGMLGAGSKGGVIFVLLTYFGVKSYRDGRFKFDWVAVVIAAFSLGLSFIALQVYFPGLESSALFHLIQYRIVANTDNLEYLYIINRTPSDYPFSGFGALFPSFSKRIGYAFEYPPGVWLHGMRFGDWSGFGPNPGIVMNYFANLSWFGLVFSIFLGWFVARSVRSSSIIGCSFLSIALLIVVDFEIFFINIFVWLFFYLLLLFFRLSSVNR